MEYERIHKPQTGIISPSKLRMKLMGPHNQKKKDGSNSNSARTSPSKLHDADFVSGLLATQSSDFEDEASLAVGADHTTSSIQVRELIMPRDDDDAADHSKLHHYSRGGGESCNSSSVHPLKSNEDENNLDYDSTSSFEFHKGERSLHPRVHAVYARQMSSKWNDAEKWILNRKTVPENNAKKPYFHNQMNRPPASSFTRVAPEFATYENKLSSVKRIDVCQTAPQSGPEKFIFSPAGSQTLSFQKSTNSALIDMCPESKDLMEVDIDESSATRTSTQNSKAIRAVSMRDMGTEMTPIPSQEPSRTASPLGSTTPMRSPISSIPSTPRRGEPAPTPTEQCVDTASQHSRRSGKKELSEQELKLKTRREIVALGVQLGKRNIAVWASKDDKSRSPSAGGNSDSDELERIEFAKRAAAWEEAEKSKHAARSKREEIKIQAWESQQKAKLEAEMRRIEAQVEQMRAQAKAKMVKKIAMARQKSEEKRAAAEAKKNQEAQQVSAQVEYIRQTGRLPSSYFICCGW
ncbi:hypothetical protein LIER_24247 [Lithospermum erythrorhizon]|uniref:Remorin C-terminal domain-containing protein n=1 Tax=Lithospermum erythrorhizon TaxID=34254 RepID=A0AAV3R0I2_LITER